MVPALWTLIQAFIGIWICVTSMKFWNNICPMWALQQWSGFLPMVMASMETCWEPKAFRRLGWNRWVVFLSKKMLSTVVSEWLRQLQLYYEALALKIRDKEKLLHLELSCGEWYARFDCVLLALFIVITQLGKGSSHNLHMIERSLL